MNVRKKIIGLLFAALAASTAYAPPVRAADPPPPDVVKACLEKYPAFAAPSDPEDPYAPFAYPADETEVNTPLGFRQWFEKARVQYHDYMECLFDKATETILAADTGTDGFWTASTPNLPHFPSGSDACDVDVLKVANGTGSPALLPFMLKAYNAYSTYLTNLFGLYESELILSGSLQATQVQVRKMKQLTENEEQDALVAIHAGLQQLLEIRQVFVIHMRLQCMIGHLEKYREILETFREILDYFPGRIIDASTVK